MAELLFGMMVVKMASVPVAVAVELDEESLSESKTPAFLPKTKEFPL